MNVTQFLTDSRVVTALSIIATTQREFYIKEFARRFQDDTMYLILGEYSKIAHNRQCLELLAISLDLNKACQEFGLRLKAPRPKTALTEAKRAQTLATIQALMATL